jgi:hypothetical protein
VRDTAAQQAFISAVAPGAVAAQRRYGVPAAVTIAQAIEESAWGQSSLAAKDNNLFGIKGTGPAGSDPQPTQESENGSWVTRTAGFRAYHNAGESIDDHGRLLATSGYYTRAMAARHSPDAFANALTGVYATDPGYGAKLIGLMRHYNLYRYDMAGPAATAGAAAPGGATIPGLPRPAAATAQGSSSDRTPAQATPAPATLTQSPPAQATPAQKSTPPQSQPAASPSATPTATRDAAGRHEMARRMPQATPSAQIMAARRLPAPASGQPPETGARSARPSTRRYQPCLPSSVSKAFITVAKVRLIRDEPLYRDVASYRDISWKLLAACDWMQCKARPGYSPVHGEKLGTVNVDGTVYRTRSEALQQCAEDLAELAWAVYHIDLTAREPLSVSGLANVFAAFRWGGLLKQHRTSAMEFPYSVAGLTPQHMKMRWPSIDDPNTPDKPGGRFRMPFGAVPIVLFLNYPATV